MLAQIIAFNCDPANLDQYKEAFEFFGPFFFTFILLTVMQILIIRFIPQKRVRYAFQYTSLALQMLCAIGGVITGFTL